LDQAAVEKIIGQTIDRYDRNEPERERLETNHETEHQIETPVDIPEINSAEIGQVTSEIPPQIDLEVEQGLNAAIESPESFESLELPIADLELLLIELDANPLEAQPEKIVEAEGAVE
jgi:hypothetical protein